MAADCIRRKKRVAVKQLQNRGAKNLNNCHLRLPPRMLDCFPFEKIYRTAADAEH
jgi:hypothetical protein